VAGHRDGGDRLYGDHPAVDFEELAAEVATEVRLLRAIDAGAGHPCGGP
jgi:hypothetical protein